MLELDRIDDPYSSADLVSCCTGNRYQDRRTGRETERESERMAQLKLFCDRISHASRAPLLLLHCAKVPHEEISVKLFRGEHMKRPELPFKKLPVLVDGDLTLAESTSILRYIGQLPGAGQWYGDRSLKEKVKIDEYLDYWQSSLHPTAIRLLQNKLMYKVGPAE